MKRDLGEAILTDNREPALVAIYVRVSTEEQAEHGYSIEAQLETLRKYCRERGKVIFDEYVDRGVSGKEMTKRRELQRLLRDAEARAFDEVAVWKLNRLSRKIKDLLEIVDRLGRNNICFRSYSENFETETPAGRMTFQMLGVIGEFERNTIVENVKMGMKQRARMGLHNGGRCLGYSTVELDGGGRKARRTALVVVPEEALVVREIFELYAEGKGFRSIANKLNREGHKTAKGNTFSSDGIREIVTNPVYVGFIRYNRFEGWSEKRRRGKNSNPIIVEGKHEAIIDQELWEKVQSLFRQRSKEMAKTVAGVSLLTGLIRCPRCGSRMVASRSTYRLKSGDKITKRYYSCGKFRRQGSSVCGANSVGAEYAERYVLDRIKEVLAHPKILKDIVAATNRRRAEGAGALEAEFATIEANLRKLADRKRRIMEVFEADGIDREALIVRLDELTVEERELSARRLAISKEMDVGPLGLLTFEDVRDLLARLDELLGKSSQEERKALLHLAIREITVKEGRIDRITLSFDAKETVPRNDEDPPANREAGGSFAISI